MNQQLPLLAVLASLVLLLVSNFPLETAALCNSLPKVSSPPLHAVPLPPMEGGARLQV